jgi:hypothetical protein
MNANLRDNDSLTAATKSFWRRRWFSLAMLTLVLGMAFCSFRLVVSVGGFHGMLGVDFGNLQTYVVTDSDWGGPPLTDLVSSFFDFRRPSIGGAPRWKQDYQRVEGLGISFPIWLISGVLVAWIVLIEIYGDPYGMRKRAAQQGD